MAIPRLYVDIDIETGQQLTLPKGAAHHVATVLRRKAGDSVLLFNGRGGEYQCLLAQSDKKAVIVDVGEFNPADRVPPLSIHLGMCILKKDPMDAVLGRVVELGVSEITPLVSDFCAVSTKMIRKRREHWQGVVVSSCEQCGLNVLPALREPIPTEEWVRQASGEEKLIALPGAGTLDSGCSPKSISLLVGCEGGFSTQELSLADRFGFKAVTFGERVLRAETAPAAAISVLHHAWGDF